MDPISAAIVNQSSLMAQSQLAQQVGVAVLRQALDVQASTAAALIQALPQPALASSGNLGTLLNVYA